MNHAQRPFSAGLEAAWLAVYRDPSAHWALYELAEELVDLEDAFRQWRFRHVTTVERIIGFKRGTGGTAGVPYLRKMLDTVLFPERWRVGTDLCTDPSSPPDDDPPRATPPASPRCARRSVRRCT